MIARRDAAAAFNDGLAALDAGSEADAIPVLRGAVAEYPDHAGLWQVLALLHRACEDLVPAIAAFERAAQLAPADMRIAQGLAHSRLEAGLPAVATFERIARQAPDDLSIQQGLAAARLGELGPDAAADGLAKVLGRYPGWLPGHALIARLRWLAGAHDRLTETIDAAIAAAPRDAARWRQRIFILKQGHQLDSALDTVRRARAAAGDDLGLRFDEATCLTETWQLDAADRAFDALPPIDDASVAVHRARHALRRQRPDTVDAIAASSLGGPQAHLLYPYLAIAWRLLGDARWSWLEGDPRLVRVVDLDETAPALASLAKRLRGLHETSGQPLEQSVRGGTQTDGPLLSRIEPEIRVLRESIIRAIGEYIAQLPLHDSGHPQLARRRDRPVRFAGSWSIRLDGGGHHVNHVHPDGWISSALYITLPGEAERGPAPAGWLALGEPEETLGLGLPPLQLIEPKPGRLVLFPSTMWHGTRPFGSGERMTLAFDVAYPR